MADGIQAAFEDYCDYDQIDALIDIELTPFPGGIDCQVPDEDDVIHDSQRKVGIIFRIKYQPQDVKQDQRGVGCAGKAILVGASIGTPIKNLIDLSWLSIESGGNAIQTVISAVSWIISERQARRVSGQVAIFYIIYANCVHKMMFVEPYFTIVAIIALIPKAKTSRVNASLFQVIEVEEDQYEDGYDENGVVFDREAVYYDINQDD
ncbi:MAG: hypothetical protein EZS28_018816 [Streblomastix strix]|uniref:Uncharacterized protein n=1 Tax=Streblomastix strix TaxID=222440 RepID=A0A5J4VTA1_9EUKA|nr:MAG: hypothetical protein EZS28_018816 [Streblomastix strix]